MRTFIIFLTLLFGIVACKKDLLPNNNSGTGNPTTNNPGGDDEDPVDNNQKVRIVRVEQTVSPNSFPFDTDELMSVDYRYTDGLLKGITVKRGVPSYTYYTSATQNGAYDFDLSVDPTFNGSGGINFESIVLNTKDEKILSGKNRFKLILGPVINKDINYTYNGSGNLTRIKSAGWLAGMKNLEVQVGAYQNGLVKNYSVKNYVQDTKLVPSIGQDYNIQVAYQTADGVPTDLVRKVNQAILGLSPMGFEDYSYHMVYDIRLDGELIKNNPEQEDLVTKYRYSFADWIVSFGLTDGYTIPNQGNQLVQSKHIQGQKLVDGKYNSNNDLVNPVYKNVDSTAQYSYVHHATERMLEIAGLKIYYEWADDESEDPTDPTIDEFGNVTDHRDGEKYKTVQIGTQTWFAENLRYAGDLPNITDGTEWVNTSTGAWSYYDNNSANDAVYGKLYNWWAVNTGDLCPQGWHIPTDGEWKTLSNYLGGESIAGGKMKSTTEDWKAPNTNATNESGFTGLPGGFRTILRNGAFGGLGESGVWWTSTGNPVNYMRSLEYKDGVLFNYFSNPYFGYSCRCIKD